MAGGGLALQVSPSLACYAVIFPGQSVGPRLVAGEAGMSVISPVSVGDQRLAIVTRYHPSPAAAALHDRTQPLMPS